MRKILLFAAALQVTLCAQGATLEEFFKGVSSCTFDHFFYSPWEPSRSHKYFLHLTPASNRGDELYTFSVSERVFGLPVVELEVPGTWDLHAITFDVPLKTARKVLLKKFGSTFPISKASRAGERPALVASEENPKQSILYCNEREGGL